MLSVYSFVILAVLVYSSNGEDGYLPPYIKPCSYDNKDLGACVKTQIENSLNSFAKGIPELDVPSLDPVQLDNIIIDGNGLKLAFTNASMHGISNSKLTNLKVALGKMDEAFSLSFKANLSLTAHYEADGQILVLPIKGNGDALVFAQGCEVTIDSNLVHYKDGKGEHLKLKSPNYKYTFERTVFHLENLFNGNKQLSDATLEFANANWQQLMDDLAPPVIKKIVKTAVKSINKFFAGVTIQQIVVGYTRS
ncbi:hypothetical protein K1T71_005125 [Dendrolimus kikuchii]|uniref:Uncharacterized protein n=1 Tax=Dendrolimus kikuchii TaxID=765133 RepID=A0ACC1D745_9NEOP|nr:hypothetical protein K1T71_005125 [Dendrolimus kikuchii]